MRFCVKKTHQQTKKKKKKKKKIKKIKKILKKFDDICRGRCFTSLHCNTFPAFIPFSVKCTIIICCWSNHINSKMSFATMNNCCTIQLIFFLFWFFFICFFVKQKEYHYCFAFMRPFCNIYVNNKCQTMFVFVTITVSSKLIRFLTSQLPRSNSIECLTKHVCGENR